MCLLSLVRLSLLGTRASYMVICLVVIMNLFLGQRRGGDVEEQAFETASLDVHECFGEARRLVLENPGARALPPAS